MHVKVFIGEQLDELRSHGAFFEPPERFCDMLAHRPVQVLVDKQLNKLLIDSWIINFSQCFSDLCLCQRIARGLQHLEQACDNLRREGNMLIGNTFSEAMTSKDQIRVKEIIL